jgi:hypothetical protein
MVFLKKKKIEYLENLKQKVEEVSDNITNIKLFEINNFKINKTLIDFKNLNRYHEDIEKINKEFLEFKKKIKYKNTSKNKLDELVIKIKNIINDSIDLAKNKIRDNNSRLKYFITKIINSEIFNHRFDCPHMIEKTLPEEIKELKEMLNKKQYELYYQKNQSKENFTRPICKKMNIIFFI